MDQVSEHALDESGLVAADIPCRACGYMLQGLEPRGRCPECSAAVEISLRGDLLRFCAPRWIERIRTGLLWVMIGVAIQLAAMMALPVVLGIVTGLAAAAGIQAGAAWMTAVIVTFSVVMAGVSLVCVIGAWMITERDPGVSETEAPVTARRLARFCITATLVATPLQTVWQQGGTAGWAANVPGSVQTVVTTLILVLGVAVIVGWAALLLYVSRLATRIPNPRIAFHARIVLWGYTCYLSLGVIVGALSNVMFPGGMPPATPGAMSVPMIIVAAGGCLLFPAAFIFELWGVGLYFFLRRALKDVADQSRAAWNA